MIQDWTKEFFTNEVLLIALFALGTSQIIKIIIEKIRTKKWDLELLISTGGMPSSHSAFVSSLAVAVGLKYGLNNPLFAIALCLAMVVIHDSMGIRRHASKQAQTINALVSRVDELEFKVYGNKSQKRIGVSEKRLKELLGHEPLEAMIGTLYGVVVAMASFYIFVN